jgi:hypothetical protein
MNVISSTENRDHLLATLQNPATSKAEHQQIVAALEWFTSTTQTKVPDEWQKLDLAARQRLADFQLYRFRLGLVNFVDGKIEPTPQPWEQKATTVKQAA